MNPVLQIVECPRDAMQGWAHFIPTDQKVAYLQQLLTCGFPILDCGSFVSPKAIPQMRDTAEVLEALSLDGSDTKLLVIVANTRGIEDAVQHQKVHYLGFPLSVSETFQQRNTNKSIAQALEEVQLLQERCEKHSKEAMVYLSMGFGNPYGDPYSPDAIVAQTGRLVAMGVRNIALADTVGVADGATITTLFEQLVPAFPEARISAHFHATPTDWKSKIEAAWAAGCTRFDGAIGGIGGCPMAKDELVGNLNTEHLLRWTRQQAIPTGIEEAAFEKAVQMAQRVFVG
ncbi:MAG: hydroxymethylglutaryl-CoA lyase [Sphingobacteriales bacterium]|nr:MAG: hydroxymethylglutaryl-CoA lyase [Sphingobacteriales bacterium]